MSHVGATALNYVGVQMQQASRQPDGKVLRTPASRWRPIALAWLSSEGIYDFASKTLDAPDARYRFALRTRPVRLPRGIRVFALCYFEDSRNRFPIC